MLVGINMCKVHSPAPEQCNLRGGFSFDLGSADAPSKKPSQKGDQRRPQLPSFAINQSRNLTRRKSRLAIDQNQVAAYTQCRCCAGNLDTRSSCNSAIARLTPAVSPKSSALTIKRLTG
jgi:hypothetical protein